jgi:hypothetical protein
LIHWLEMDQQQLYIVHQKLWECDHRLLSHIIWHHTPEDWCKPLPLIYDTPKKQEEKTKEKWFHVNQKKQIIYTHMDFC